MKKLILTVLAGSLILSAPAFAQMGNAEATGAAATSKGGMAPADGMSGDATDGRQPMMTKRHHHHHRHHHHRHHKAMRDGMGAVDNGVSSGKTNAAMGNNSAGPGTPSGH